MVLYDEDHYEYKNNISQNNTDIDNIWKSMKNNIDKEKDLKPVDHSKMNYDFFTKDIYIESPEISKLTNEEVMEIRKTNGSILVKGKDIPKPILEFYQCGLNTKIMEILSSKEIKKPFPIQMQAYNERQRLPRNIRNRFWKNFSLRITNASTCSIEIGGN